MPKVKSLIITIIIVLIVMSVLQFIVVTNVKKDNKIASVAQYKTAETESNIGGEAELFLSPSTTEVHMGDTITITISAKCSTGLGGVDAVLDWDKNKIQFTNQEDEVFQLSGIDDSTGKFKLSVLYNGDEKEADLATLEFKILDTAVVREVLNISLSDIEIIDNNIDSISINDMGVVLNVKDHTFTNYISNNDAKCTEDGTKTAKCDKCNAVNTIKDVGSATGHSFTNYISDNNAKCTEDGTKTAKCDKCSELKTIPDVGSATGHNYQNGKCIECGEDAPQIIITSEKYEISEKYITKISHKTTLKSFIESLEITNAIQVSVLDKNDNKLTENDLIGTGTKLVVKSEVETKIIKLVIVGDTTGDGLVDFKDMVAINKHRLNQKILQEEYFIAGEVTGNNKVGFEDIVKINQFRLNKIAQLFQ